MTFCGLLDGVAGLVVATKIDASWSVSSRKNFWPPRLYDARGWTKRVANLDGESDAAPCDELTNPLQAFEYEYDGRGNRLSETLTRGTTS